jgi:hypothetical protein
MIVAHIIYRFYTRYFFENTNFFVELDIVQKLEFCVVKSKPAKTGRSIYNSFSNGAHSEEAHEEQQHLANNKDIKK